MKQAYRNEFDLEREKTDLSKDNRKYDRDVYVPPTKEAGYNIFQYIVEAEYFFPAWAIALGVMLLVATQLPAALSGATHDSPAMFLFVLLALPTVLVLASFFVSGMERVNEMEVKTDPRVIETSNREEFLLT
ncbi:MAG: hypothetical protein R3B54_05125 [Bdellovibrionota bacterium]